MPRLGPSFPPHSTPLLHLLHYAASAASLKATELLPLPPIVLLVPSPYPLTNQYISLSYGRPPAPLEVDITTHHHKITPHRPSTRRNTTQLTDGQCLTPDWLTAPNWLPNVPELKSSPRSTSADFFVFVFGVGGGLGGLHGRKRWPSPSMILEKFPHLRPSVLPPSTFTCITVRASTTSLRMGGSLFMVSPI